MGRPRTKPPDGQPWLCSRGHDKNKVGVIKTQKGSYYCRECKRILDAKYYQERKEGGLKSNRPMCKNNHIYVITGITKDGRCKACRKAASRKYNAKKARAKAKANPNSKMYAQAVPRLRELRESLGWSRPDLARRSGVTVSQLEKIELRGQKARPYVLHRIMPVIAEEIKKEKEFMYG
jgi:DNA-binding transcriptional regulator YiaG